MDKERFPELMKMLYTIVAELEEMFPGRHFTPDGHLVGSIGEALAAYYYGLELLPASTKGKDATINGIDVEIKATQARMVAFGHEPEHALVLKIDQYGAFEEIYNGPGNLIWEQFKDKKLPSNGQYAIGISKLKQLNEQTPPNARIKRIR